jgi:hypothetical protein
MSQCSKSNFIFTLNVNVVCRCLVSAPDSHQHTSGNNNQPCYLFTSCDTIMIKLEVSILSYYETRAAFTELHVCVRWPHLIYLSNLSNMFVRKWRAHWYTNLIPGKEGGERLVPIWNSLFSFLEILHAFSILIFIFCRFKFVSTQKSVLQSRYNRYYSLQ